MLSKHILSLAVFALAVSARPHRHGHVRRKTCSSSSSSGNSTSLPTPTSTSDTSDDTTSAPDSTAAPTSTAPPTSTTLPPSGGGGGDSGCFPMSSNLTVSDDITSTPVDSWWCAADKMYGFMGFSYPLEDSDCSASSNSYDQINQDFAKMKSFGATMVRVYAPECRDKSIWENLLKAGITNSMGVIPQIWWGFGDQSLWQKTRDSIYAVIDENPLAPYIFQSIAVGSEPIGDGVLPDDQFVDLMKSVKAEVGKKGILVAMSEDWDRQGKLTDGDGLTQLGKDIAAASDMLQLHPMPYYHCNKYPQADNVMDYFKFYIEDLVEKSLPGLPIFVTETQWSSSSDTFHKRGCGEPGEDIDNFKTFWNTWQNNCDYWKQHKVGWFTHTFSDSFETGFGMLDNNGNTKMNFMPQRC